jgi:hypothetical protein
MRALRYTALLAAIVLSGCSMFHHDDADPSQATASKKKFSLWPLGKGGPQDATEFLEYERIHSEKDKALTALVVRNTHPSKTIEGDIRTTIETGMNESKIDTSHFSLGPSDSKKLLVFPTSTKLSYEVSAFFKQ